MFHKKVVTVSTIAFALILFFSIKMDYAVINIIDQGKKKNFSIFDKNKNECKRIRRFKTYLTLIDDFGVKYRVQILKKECNNLNKITAYCLNFECYTYDCRSSTLLIFMKFLLGVGFIFFFRF
jgi:hypothetical protein